MAKILVIDDEPDLRTLYELTLLREGHEVQTAGTVTQAHTLLQQQAFDLVLTDMRLPDGLGLDLLRTLSEDGRNERSIVITAYGSAENAVEALKYGAFDYLTKPVNLEQFRKAIRDALQATSRQHGATSPPTAVADKPRPPAPAAAGEKTLARLVGDSEAMRAVKQRILQVAPSMAPILVHGESGTGKELVARAIHACSHRSDGPFIPVNCSAIPENLLEAEFFGARKGSYTGATQDRKGFFQAAAAGTLFLDEIGDLPRAMQAKLLRAIQERKIRPLGATTEHAVDVRLVSATHKDLAAEVAAGRFREDLYYRLNVIALNIPPLRERRADIPDIARALLQRIAEQSQTPPVQLTVEQMNRLVQARLKGNVRELENLLHRFVALGGSALETLASVAPAAPHAPEHAERTPAATPAPGARQNQATTLAAWLDAQERSILLSRLEQAGGDLTAAAAALELSVRQLHYRMQRLELEPAAAGGMRP